MLKVQVKDLENDRTWTAFGDEKYLLKMLAGQFPVGEARTLDQAQAEMEATDLFEVKVEPYEPAAESNILPPDYLTAEQGEDAWPREGDVI
jgi:hypothetical protein